MARKDKPYLPLYIQDFMTDEKLMECSASATGVYVRIMCVMHKSIKYGTFLLKQKDKHSDNQILNFASKLGKHLPYDLPVIISGIEELICEGCLIVEGDYLIQKRMVEDGALSETRSESGRNGGKKTQSKRIKNKDFAKANNKANTDIDIDIDIDIENVLKGGMGENNDGLCYDIEKYLVSRQKEFEAVCMNCKKDSDEVKEILTNYHLWNVQNEIYPKKPLPLIAGFQRWVLNEKKFKKNGTHSKETGTIGKTIEFDKL